MVLNLTKTKEVVLGPPSITSNLLSISASSHQIQRASEAKLLGVHIDSNLSWHTHVEAIVSKAIQRLYFLKQLKRARVPHAQLLHFYISVIRPVLEYAVPVWHHLLTKSQTNSIESVQKRALRIIYPFSNDMPCSNYLDLADLDSYTVSTQRNELSHKFFHSIVHPTSSLHCLLPPPRDPDLLAPTKFPRIPSQTKKYQSFVSYALSRYQTYILSSPLMDHTLHPQ